MYFPLLAVFNVKGTQDTWKPKELHNVLFAYTYNWFLNSFWNNFKCESYTSKRYDIHTKLKVGMSFIPTFGMILVVASSYQIWYEFHTLVFAVYNFKEELSLLSSNSENTK